MNKHTLSHRIARPLFALALFAVPLFSMAGDSPQVSPRLMATVYNLTRVKILDSNSVSLRPGSVYDNETYFEALGDFPKPGYNYEFLDSGLGAAEPLYPMFQKGNQHSYLQLVPAYVSDSKRHIDHYSSLETPEGCKVDGIYLLRGMDEYPANVFAKERAEGYKQIVIRLDYYTRLRPDAQCGRHVANDPDPNFDPMKYMEDHHDSMMLSDFAGENFDRFEAKVSAIYQIVEKLSPVHARFDLNALNNNSLWYYPNGHTADYGINKPIPQPSLDSFKIPAHMHIDATAPTQARYPLDALLKAEDLSKLLDFWNGKPTENFNANTEPGHDTLRLSDVTTKNIYTSGLEIEHIQNVAADVSNSKNYKLVGMTIKPFEEQTDSSWEGVRVIPQIRFVYQLMDPKNPERPFEQLFVHLKWDVVNRLADQKTRDEQHRYFLGRVDELTKAREENSAAYADTLHNFINEFTSARPTESIAFSSALTGIWVFGTLSRDFNTNHELKAMRVVREGIDYGYYSSTFDNDLLRAEIKRSNGPRRADLEKLMADLTVGFFRDPKRQDPHSVNFNRVSCAQCHQTSGRDGVHMMLNDGLNKKITSPTITSEYFFHDAEMQLKSGAAYWKKHLSM